MAEKEDITSVYVAGKMFNYASYIDAFDNEELENNEEITDDDYEEVTDDEYEEPIIEMTDDIIDQHI